MDNIPLRRRMRAWRDFRGLSQARTAEPAGWTGAAIGQIERGKADMTVGKLAIICRKAFKTDLRTFFGPLPSRECAP
jgi:transcriptional regulator with XRE-family HTH domain